MVATEKPLVGLLGLMVSALLVGSGNAAGNAEVFDIGKSLKPFEYTVMMTVIILGLVAFDFVLESFEHHLEHEKKRFHQRLLGKGLKELMILGLISFVLFVLKDQALYDQTDDVLTNTFDFVNLFLFFVGVSLVLAAVLLVMATAPIKARWDTYANAPLANLLDLHEALTSKSWTWYAAWLPRYSLAMKQAQVIEYHLFRSVFLRLNRSLLTPAFDFSKYSGAIVDELIVRFFDVGWASWLLAVVVLFVTLPITVEGGGHAQVSVQGTVLFGMALLAFECFTCAYTQYAHRMVMARMGVVGGFKGVGKVLKELWVEPQHHMGQETTAIDVKDLLAAAPVNAPTLSQLTSEVSESTRGASKAQVNFRSERNSVSSSASQRRLSANSTGSTHGPSSEGLPQLRATATANTNIANSNTSTNIDHNNLNTNGTSTTATATGVPTAPMAEPTVISTAAAAASKPACPTNGFSCTGCYDCDALFLPDGKVSNCAMGGDPYVITTLRPPQSVVDRLPELLKGVSFKVGSYWWFQTLFGMGTLLKCYYSAFYFSYAIGKATQ